MMRTLLLADDDTGAEPVSPVNAVHTYILRFVLSARVIGDSDRRGTGCSGEVAVAIYEGGSEDEGCARDRRPGDWLQLSGRSQI
jgi:hypothetical protein